MADNANLPRLAFPIDERPIQFVRRASANPIAGAPEVGGTRLVGDVPQHPGDRALADLPERLATKLEVIALLIDRPAAVAVNENPLFDIRDEGIERRVLRSGLQRDVRHASERNA